MSNDIWHRQLIEDTEKGHDEWLEARSRMAAVLDRVTAKLLANHPDDVDILASMLEGKAANIRATKEADKRKARGRS